MNATQSGKEQLKGLTLIKLKDVFGSISKTPRTIKKKKNKDIDKEDRGEPHVSSQLMFVKMGI